MKWLLLIAVFGLPGLAIGQKLNERKNIVGGSSLWENFMQEMYLLPEFADGKIIYKDGREFNRKVNYNRILETMQFISDNGDTLVFADDAVIRQVNAGELAFYYLPQCLQLLAGVNGVRLLKHEKVRIADIRRKGALGIPNSTSAIESINQVYTWMNSYQLDINEVLLLAKTTTFFLESESKILPASRKNFLQVYKKNQSAVDAFIKKNKISFTKEKDLIALTNFANSQ